MEETKTNQEDKSKRTETNYPPSEDEVSDPELDELLDDALLDFDATGTNCSKDSEDKKEVASPPGPSGASASTDAMYNEIFNDESQKQFGDMMQAFMDPKMMENIQKLTQAAAQPGGEGSEKNFEETLRETLGGLSKNAEDLQNDVSEDELLKLLSNMNLPEGDEEAGAEGSDDLNLMPMMQGMMKSLLSKDVLYPSLKDISTKYPKWLEDNKSKTNEKDFKNYERQFAYMKDICSEFEAEKAGDSESLKKERFEKVLDLMQDMQELGYPPKDLVGDMPAGFPMGPEAGGMPKLEKCSVM